MASDNIISQRDALNWLSNPDVSFVDGSWYLHSQNRNAKEEFSIARIPGAVFFDIDAIADPDTDLPHMLPHPEVFAEVAGVLGLSHDKLIIVYDGPGMFSAPRVWWTLKVMGAQNVKVLEGGFDTWKTENLPVERGIPNQPRQSIFQAHLAHNKVASRKDVENNIEYGRAITLDARPNDRFKGTAPEPREGMRSGHIPKSLSLPASDLIENGKLLEVPKLNKIFHEMLIYPDSEVITTCGSGVTAAILTLALHESGRENTRLYDGSWAEWGRPDGPEISCDDK
jgi:thiosulfate/3-mercaptopyruvate sulfurtransferase